MIDRRILVVGGAALVLAGGFIAGRSGGSEPAQSDPTAPVAFNEEPGEADVDGLDATKSLPDLADPDRKKPPDATATPGGTPTATATADPTVVATPTQPPRPTSTPEIPDQ